MQTSFQLDQPTELATIGRWWPLRAGSFYRVNSTNFHTIRVWNRTKRGHGEDGTESGTIDGFKRFLSSQNAPRLGSFGFRQVPMKIRGSEEHIVQVLLAGEGIAAAVVSLPCWELFAETPQAYREEVLGRGTLRIGIEAGIGWGWERHLGPDGIFIGMRGFGASAPYAALYKHFGITAEAVVAAAKARL